MAVRVREILAGETVLAFPAMRELRTAWVDEQAFVQRIDEIQREEGYRLIGAFENEGPALAVAGFRLTHYLSWGRHIYVDDLCTHPDARRRGLGRTLLEWVFDEARRLECVEVHLDSAVHRHDAHRLYLNTGFVISAYHFRRALDG